MTFHVLGILSFSESAHIRYYSQRINCIIILVTATFTVLWI